MKKISKNKKPTVVAVSGGFDPLHIGHIRLLKVAKKFGDKLIVILNNDNWLRKKKGFVFMPQKERKELIEALTSVDKVILTSHPKNPTDMSVCKDLKKSSRIFLLMAAIELRRIFPKWRFAMK